MDVHIRNRQRVLKIDHDKLKGLVVSVGRAEGFSPRSSVSLAFVNNRTIAELNRKHLGRKGPTDVLSFPLGEVPGAAMEDSACGEIVVSAEQAKKKSAEFGHSPHDELALYVIHGLLHLTGYSDHDQAHSVRMRRRENQLLREFWLKEPRK